ncbi:hypothetical protein PIIN_09128 [Serendipita indica DSM 11827]|uniref:Nephrocystin 3-like N-terminal domain-containing protein n=1 Tax=Serendipita indica (strain DSM 11827) TaxID=1109443 RepID=G4TV01_SERID|nr:hypothetical protein PIIN_09128 [Serendipita indica DSM 11827]
MSSNRRPTTGIGGVNESPTADAYSSRKRGSVYGLSGVPLDVLASPSEASDMLSPLRAANRLIESILEAIQEINDNEPEWTELAHHLEGYWSDIENRIESFKDYSSEQRAIDDAFRRPFTVYVEFLKDLHVKIANLRHKRRAPVDLFTKRRRMKIDPELVFEFGRNIDDQHGKFMEAISLYTPHCFHPLKECLNNTKSKAMNNLTQGEASAILQLPMAAFSVSSVHRTCLQGTREAVLQTIWRWARDDSAEKPIFWLCDIAGAGKSTVAMSAIEAWQNQGTLGAHYFFSMTSCEGSSVDKFCSTIARRLVEHIPELAPRIAQAAKQNPSVMRCPLSEQFQTLVTSSLHSWSHPVIIVIDGIDECKSGAQRKKLLDTLAMAARECSRLKILITSRPDPVIEGILQPISIKSKLDIGPHDFNHRTDDDTALYINRSLTGVLPEDKRQLLSQKSHGLFIWASIACQIINENTADSSSICERLIAMDGSGNIEDLYDLVFETTDPGFHSTMRAMLALLLALFEPLTSNDMNDLFKYAGVHGSIDSLVRKLRSVVFQDRETGVIQFRHSTFVEYLGRRCTAPPINRHDKLFIDVTNAHGRIASWCLKGLKENLRFNICNLESSFYLNHQVPDIHERDSAPHIYISALPFTPTKSMLHVEGKKVYRNTLTVTQGLQEDYSGPPETLHGHEDSVRGISFSADGSMFVSGSADTTIRLWDADTGQPVGEPIRGHTDSVLAIAFSPDGSKIASGSSDQTIRVWDVESGQIIGEPLQGHEHRVSSLAFSPDGSRIVSGSWDFTVRLWDADLGAPVGEPLRGHEEWVTSVAFSPNGLLVASSSWDKTIRLWEAETGQPAGEPLRGHESWVNSVAFSPDGSKLVTTSWDMTIRLWNVKTGMQLGTAFEGHEDDVNVAVFSPDGSRIISGSLDSTIRVWDPANSKQVGSALQGHHDSIMTIAFSPDGSTFASGSSDGTIRLWDAKEIQPVGTPCQGHGDSVQAVAFSPSGDLIASCSSDETIRLWDATTGRQVGEPLRGHEGGVDAIAFSPDGSLLASGSVDAEIRLWDVRAHQQLTTPLRGHHDSVNAVAFSPDGSLILSGSADNTLRLWDVNTGQELGEPFLGHKGAIRAVAFSPDGSRVVSGSDDETLRLWNVNSGQPLGPPIRGHEGSVRAVGFSPDGSRIVSGSFDRTIRLWNVETGQPLGKSLEGHEDLVHSLAFSPDGLRIVSASEDKTLRFWDVRNFQQVGEPLLGHQNAVNSVAFSPDGILVVSGSSDKTIRLWNVNTGRQSQEMLLDHDQPIEAKKISPETLGRLPDSNDELELGE